MKFPILLPNIFNYPFTYESNLKLNAGDYVEVPFGKSKVIGVVWDEFEKNYDKKFKIKTVTKKLNITPLKLKTIKFLNWFAVYNIVPKGMVLKLVLLSNKAIEKAQISNYQDYELKEQNKLFNLSEDQKKILKEINSNNNKFKVHVLQGVTGSGKTIVYFENLKEIIKKKFQVLILLPEIGLTSQFEKKFYEFFGFKAAIWHSGISKKKKNLSGVE